MDAPLAPSLPALGFVAVRERAPFGYFGGYLIINALGRPLEFHCSLPVQPSRAQQILYGGTLEEFVCGEQIARALLTRAKTRPQAVLADCGAVLAARHWVDLPLLWLEPSECGDHFGELGRIEDGDSLSATAGEDSGDFRLPKVWRKDATQIVGSIGEQSLRCLLPYARDAVSFSEVEAIAAQGLDLAEPFERILEALREAHPRTKAA